MFENPRRARQARNFTTYVPKILDLKSSSEPKETSSCLTTLNKGTGAKDIRNDFTILYVGDPFLGPLREERGGCQNRPSLYANVVGNHRDDSNIKVEGWSSEN